MLDRLGEVFILFIIALGHKVASRRAVDGDWSRDSWMVKERAMELCNFKAFYFLKG